MYTGNATPPPSAMYSTGEGFYKANKISEDATSYVPTTAATGVRAKAPETNERYEDKMFEKLMQTM